MKHIFNCHSLFLIIAGFCLLWGCRNSTDGEIIYLENGMLRLGFDRNTGAMIEMRDLAQSIDFLESNTITGPPWEIVFLKEGEIQPMDPAIPFAFSFSRNGGSSIEMIWESNGKTIDLQFTVTVYVVLEPDKPMSNWKISVSGIPAREIHAVVFPNITGLKDLENERLLVPHWMGQEMENPRKFLSALKSDAKKFEWEYPGQLSMQFLSLYNPEKTGLFISSRDTLAFRKNYSVSMDTMGLLCCRINNFPSLDGAHHYSPPYETAIGCFTGDWLSQWPKFTGNGRMISIGAGTAGSETTTALTGSTVPLYGYGTGGDRTRCSIPQLTFNKDWVFLSVCSGIGGMTVPMMLDFRNISLPEKAGIPLLRPFRMPEEKIFTQSFI
jgi:hypothetical protein